MNEPGRLLRGCDANLAGAELALPAWAAEVLAPAADPLPFLGAAPV